MIAYKPHADVEVSSLLKYLGMATTTTTLRRTNTLSRHSFGGAPLTPLLLCASSLGALGDISHVANSSTASASHKSSAQSPTSRAFPPEFQSIVSHLFFRFLYRQVKFTNVGRPAVRRQIATKIPDSLNINSRFLLTHIRSSSAPRSTRSYSTCAGRNVCESMN